MSNLKIGGTSPTWALTLILVAVSTFGCDSFVETVDDPIHIVTDENLDDESQVGFLANGVWAQFGLTYGRLSTRAGWLSDELTTAPRNNNGSNKRIDNGIIPLDEFQTRNLHEHMGLYRALSHDLITRMDRIDFTDPELRRQGLFAGHLHAGIARYFIASFGGKTEREGGGVITIIPTEPGRFIPSDSLYRQALAHLSVARDYGSESDHPFINTIVARIHLLLGNLALARDAAMSGLAEGDAPFNVLYTTIGNKRNQWIGVSSPSTQDKGWVFGSNYQEFIDQDPQELERIPLIPTLGPDSTVYYVQGRYTERDSPQPFATWQENELILAEFDLRDGDAGSALSRVNTVRAHYGISPLESINLAVLEEERRKELWGTGLRLIDQRRFDSWHLEPGTWQYFPIPQAERDINPNL